MRQSLDPVRVLDLRLYDCTDIAVLEGLLHGIICVLKGDEGGGLS